MRVSRFNFCMFCEIRLSLVSCSCEYCSSVPFYRVSSGPGSVTGEQEQIVCGKSQ